MSHDVESALVSASKSILAKIHDRYESEEDSRAFVKLNAEQISDLSVKILAFPDDDIAILLLRYAFGFDYDSIAIFLKQDAVKGKLRYLEQLLSGGMGLLENQGVDGGSLRVACKAALHEYIADGNEETVHDFSEAVRQIKAVNKKPSLIFAALQKVAIVFVVISVSFGIALGANAEFREQVYQWFVETFPRFSSFALGIDTEGTELSFENLCLYRPTYIPEGYSEKSIDFVYPSIYYDYTDVEGRLLTIVGNLPNQAPISLNTEDESVEKIVFQGENAYYWEKDGISYFVFILYGYHFDIVGQFSMNEIVNIAESIKIA